jgi:hypothetical protein
MKYDIPIFVYGTMVMKCVIWYYMFKFVFFLKYLKYEPEEDLRNKDEKLECYCLYLFVWLIYLCLELFLLTHFSISLSFIPAFIMQFSVRKIKSKAIYKASIRDYHSSN